MSAQCDSTRWNFPLLPAGPRNLSHHFGATCSPDSATGGCPPPSLSHISERTPLSNEEAPFPQVLTALFRRVLRKKHAVVNGSKLAFCLFQSGTKYRFIFNRVRAILCLNLERNSCLHTSAKWSDEPPD